MGKSSADVKLTVSQRSAVAALDHFQRRFDQMTKKMQKSTEQTAKNTKQTNEQFNKMPGVLRRAVSGAVLLNETIAIGKSLVNDYLQSYSELADKAETSRTSKIGYQEYLKQALEILPRNSDMNGGQIDAAMRGANVSSPKNLVRGLMAAISATSDMPVSQRAQTTIELGKMRPELLKSFPGAFEELVKTVVSGQARLKEANNSAYAQMGMMNLGQSTSAVTDPRLFAKNIAPLGYQLGAYGINQGEAFALASAVGLKAGESEGAITGTGILNLMKVLNVEARKSGIKSEGMDLLEGVAFGQDKKFKGLRNRVLGAYSQDTEFQKAMMSMSDSSLKPELGQRARTFLPIIDLIQGNKGAGSTWQMMNQSIREMGLSQSGEYRVDMSKSYAQVDKFQRKRSADFAKAPYLSALYTGEHGESFLSGAQLANNRGEQAKFILDIVESMKSFGVPDINTKLPFAAFGSGYTGKARKYAAGFGKDMSERQVYELALDMVHDRQARAMVDGSEMGRMHAVGLSPSIAIRHFKKMAAHPDATVEGLSNLVNGFDNEQKKEVVTKLEAIEQRLLTMISQLADNKKVRIENPVAPGAAPNGKNLGGENE